jgi:Flp pilus assembly pilin Flp
MMGLIKNVYEALRVRLFGSLRGEKGQTMIEYAMVAVFIAIVLIFCLIPGSSPMSGAARLPVLER